MQKHRHNIVVEAVVSLSQEEINRKRKEARQRLINDYRSKRDRRIVGNRRTVVELIEKVKDEQGHLV